MQVTFKLHIFLSSKYNPVHINIRVNRDGRHSPLLSQNLIPANFIYFSPFSQFFSSKAIHTYFFFFFVNRRNLNAPIANEEKTSSLSGANSEPWGWFNGVQGRVGLSSRSSRAAALRGSTPRILYLAVPSVACTPAYGPYLSG